MARGEGVGRGAALGGLLRHGGVQRHALRGLPREEEEEEEEEEEDDEEEEAKRHRVAGDDEKKQRMESPQAPISSTRQR